MSQILHRVLSFDGGGIRGLYQAHLLERLKARGLDVAAHADVVTGTSTGAIVAAALASGIEVDAISKFYTDLGKKVFPPGRISRGLRRVKSWTRAKPSYSSSVLREALQGKLNPKATLGDCSKRLIIPAISLSHYKLKIFDSKDEGDKKANLIDVVLASAAAPTYFLPSKVGATYYVDGGLCCNNPAFRAVGQLCREGVELTRIYVLAISTGAVPVKKAGKRFLRFHKLGWIRPALDLAMSGSSDLAVQDGALVGYHCRVSETLGTEIGLDDYTRALDSLPALAEGKAEEVRGGVKRWIDGPVETGANFAGTWNTLFEWGSANQTATDKLRVSQCGDFVSGETVSGSGQWQYTLSGTVRGNVLIGEWIGTTLRGSFLLIKSQENQKVMGRWVGMGDAEPYAGQWSWDWANE